MRTPPLLADFSHARACKPFCENSLTLPHRPEGRIFRAVNIQIDLALQIPKSLPVKTSGFDLTLDYFFVKLYNLLGHGLLSPFRMVCRNFILPEICKPCLFIFAKLIVPYRKRRSKISFYARCSLIKCFFLHSLTKAIRLSYHSNRMAFWFVIYNKAILFNCYVSAF